MDAVETAGQRRGEARASDAQGYVQGYDVQSYDVQSYEEEWPPLPLEAWRDTAETLHRYLQVIGKVKLATTCLVCHFWNAALTVTPRGLSTETLECGARTFDIELDFIEHEVVIRSSDGRRRALALAPRSVADFRAEVLALLESLGVRVRIWDQPVEIFEDAIPLSRDQKHASYDAPWVSRFWRVLSSSAAVLAAFRSRFIGKTSPVGFYWGTFDLAAARYSGARAPEPPAGAIEHEAYSHELSEAGFWPGDARYPHPAFYALHAPAPPGYGGAKVSPSAAFFDEKIGCWLLPYEVIRDSPSPRATLLDFWQTAYEAGAKLAGWDRRELERPTAHPPARPSDVTPAVRG
jgi:hypothetical protein